MPMDQDETAAMKRVARVRDEPQDQVYAPPPGSPQYTEAMQRLVYIPDVVDTSKTDFLHPFEMKHVFPLAWAVAPVFGANPLPDSLYATMPPEPRASNLNVVVSRTGIRKVRSGLIAWPAVMVVVKQIPLVKLICTLDLTNDKFAVTQLIFWINGENKYSDPVTNDGKPIQVGTIQQMLERYRDIEGIR